MTADYAEPLKRAWWEVTCDWDCRNTHRGDSTLSYCKGHAALLEMVDAVHLPLCMCHPRLGIGESVSADTRCKKERRRLRAAVGVEEKTKKEE